MHAKTPRRLDPGAGQSFGRSGSIATLRGRTLLVCGLSIGSLVFVIGFIAARLWIDSRFAGPESAGALALRAQQPAANQETDLPDREAENFEQRRADAVLAKDGLTLQQALSRFVDGGTGIAERRTLASRLARDGSSEALAALSRGLQSATAEHKAALLEAIGNSGNPAVKSSLWPWLEDADAKVVAGAIRGLSAVGGDDVTVLLGAILSDSSFAESIRSEAVLGLGAIGSPAARDALVMAAEKASGDLSAQLFTALGRFEFPSVARTFEGILAAPDRPTELRIAATEALAHSSAAAVPFLFKLAGSDGDPAVRSAAAWAISAHEGVEHLAPALADAAAREPSTDVRRRLYEALLPQADIPAERLLPMVQAEHDIAARVAGFNALGRAAQQNPGTAAAVFDREIAPELVQIATGPNSVNIQMRAVFALRRAQTVGAQAALVVIAERAKPQVAAAARNGLKGRSG